MFGLYNAAQKYNCFLNSVLQVFWNIESFRQFFKFYAQNDDPLDIELIRNLKEFFYEIMERQKAFYEDDTVIDPEAIRVELAKKFPSSYPMGEQADATELFEHIFTLIHENEVAKVSKHSVSKSAPSIYLIGHKMQLDLNIIVDCGCGVSESVKQNAEQYVIFLPARTAVSDCEVSRQKSLEANMEALELRKGFLATAIKRSIAENVNLASLKHKKGKCKKQEQSTVTISTNKEPDILTIDAKWEQFHALQLLVFFYQIPLLFSSEQIFHFAGDAKGHDYLLKGIIAYQGAHYFSYFRMKIGLEHVWLRFDDKNIIRKEGWAQIVEECLAT